MTAMNEWMNADETPSAAVDEEENNKVKSFHRFVCACTRTYISVWNSLSLIVSLRFISCIIFIFTEEMLRTEIFHFSTARPPPACTHHFHPGKFTPDLFTISAVDCYWWHASPFHLFLWVFFWSRWNGKIGLKWSHKNQIWIGEKMLLRNFNFRKSEEKTTKIKRKPVFQFSRMLAQRIKKNEDVHTASKRLQRIFFKLKLLDNDKGTTSWK